MAAKLILTRNGAVFNRRQRFKVLIDGAEAGQIKNDDTREFTLEPGDHSVQCKLYWMTSQVETVNLKDGANTYLTVSNGLKFIVPLYFLMLVGVLFPFYFHLVKAPVPEYVSTLKVVLILPAILYYILYLTIFRKRYLVIGEDKSNPFK
ncbi:MAG: hypothetical protein JWR18_1973 [Segetibacter sp.]|jgi:hypothetical protein|nr:hypothetical protein [Segetibacter sp.]